jgi:DNA sulfur modification protein DndB
MTNVSIAELARYFQPFFEREQASKKQPLSLAQRTLNLPRVKKVAQYILKGCMPHSFYVLPPATVTVSIPETESFDFWGVDFEDEDQSLDSLPSPTEIGTLALPPNARFWLADGQHRIAGAIQAYREGAALLGQETIGLMLIPDADGAKEKQIFLDINKHAVKPNQSILALFDGSDTYCEIARSVLIGVPVFEGRTALEGTNAKGVDLWTMNNLKECSKLLCKGLEGDSTATAIQFWQAVAEHHPDWRTLETKDAETLRAETLSFHAITMNAIALIGNQQFRDHQGHEWLKGLNRINWSADNPDLEGICRFGDRITKNSKTAKALARYFLEQMQK